MHESIAELIETYPEVSLRDVDIETLVEIADRWLRTEAAKRRRATARSFEQVSQRAEIIDAGLANAVNRTVRETAERIQNEWAPSLLAQSFALPDGRLVRWGDASLADHEARASHLEKHAAGELQTAALHRRAISDIRSSGRASLAAYAEEAAA